MTIIPRKRLKMLVFIGDNSTKITHSGQLVVDEQRIKLLVFLFIGYAFIRTSLVVGLVISTQLSRALVLCGGRTLKEEVSSSLSNQVVLILCLQ